MVEISKSINILEAEVMEMLYSVSGFHYRLQNGSRLKLPREKQESISEGPTSSIVKATEFFPGLLEMPNISNGIEYF